MGEIILDTSMVGLTGSSFGETIKKSQESFVANREARRQRSDEQTSHIDNEQAKSTLDDLRRRYERKYVASVQNGADGQKVIDSLRDKIDDISVEMQKNLRAMVNCKESNPDEYRELSAINAKYRQEVSVIRDTISTVEGIIRDKEKQEQAEKEKQEKEIKQQQAQERQQKEEEKFAKLNEKREKENQQPPTAAKIAAQAEKVDLPEMGKWEVSTAVKELIRLKGEDDAAKYQEKLSQLQMQISEATKKLAEIEKIRDEWNVQKNKAEENLTPLGKELLGQFSDDRERAVNEKVNAWQDEVKLLQEALIKVENATAEVEPEEQETINPEPELSFQAREVTVTENNVERPLRAEELGWFTLGGPVECVSGYEAIGDVAHGGIDNGSHVFRLYGIDKELQLISPEFHKKEDDESEVDARFKPQTLGEIESIKVYTSEWSEKKTEAATKLNHYEVRVTLNNGQELRFVRGVDRLSEKGQEEADEARKAYEKADRERQTAADKKEQSEKEAIKAHENETKMKELLEIKKDLDSISRVAMIGLRDDGNGRLLNSNFDKLQHEVRRKALVEELNNENTAQARKEEIKEELDDFKGAIKLKFGDRKYDDYLQALQGEINVQSVQLAKFTEEYNNRKDGLKPHERYAYEEARKALDMAIATQLEHKAIDAYRQYEDDITNADLVIDDDKKLEYKYMEGGKEITAMVSLLAKDGTTKLSLQGKLDEISGDIAEAQRYIDHVDKYTKAVDNKIKEQKAFIARKLKEAQTIRDFMRQKESVARDLMTLRQIFYTQAAGRVEEEQTAESEMGIKYDVTNGNNEFYSYDVGKLIDRILSNTTDKDERKGILDSNVIGRMNQIKEESERDATNGSGIARLVNPLRQIGLASTFVDKAYYGISGNDGVFANKLTSEMIMLSGQQLLQAKCQALKALEYRARNIDPHEEQQVQKLEQALIKHFATEAVESAKVEEAQREHDQEAPRHANQNKQMGVDAQVLPIRETMLKAQNDELGYKGEQERLGPLIKKLQEAKANRKAALERTQEEVAVLEKYRDDIFARYDKLMAQWEEEKQELRQKVVAKKNEIKTQEKAKQELINQRRRDLFALDDKAEKAKGDALLAIQSERAAIMADYSEQGGTGKIDKANEQLAKLQAELVDLHPEKLDSKITFKQWLAEKIQQGENPELDEEELKIIEPYLADMEKANQAFKTQRDFAKQVNSTWLLTVVGSFSCENMSLTSGTNDMHSFFGRLSETTHLRASGVSNPENMEITDMWNGIFGKGRFDAETQRYMDENSDLQAIVAMCVAELRNPKGKYWAGDSGLSQSDGVRKLVDEMFNVYCNTTGRETIGKMSKEQQEFEKQLVLIKIARDDLVRKYAVEAYGVWFTALKNKQWDKLRDSGTLMALTYGLVRGKNGDTLAKLDFINLDEIIVKIREQIDKYYPEGSDEDKARYQELQKEIHTEELIMRAAQTDEERLSAEARVNTLRKSIGDLGKRYDQLASLELLKSRVERHRDVAEAAHPSGTLQEQEQHDQRLREHHRRTEAAIREDLEKSQENRPGLMKKIWRTLIGSPEQPPVRQTAKKWRYLYSVEEYSKMMRSVNPHLTSEKLESIIENAKSKGLVTDGPSRRVEVISDGETKEVDNSDVDFKISEKTDYSYKPLDFAHDAVTMDAFLNQPPEGRQAAADWLDAHDAFGDIMDICSQPVDKSLVEDSDKLIEVINKINTNFSRIASIALDNSDANMATLSSGVRYNYMREMAEAAYCGWIENVLHTVGGFRPTRWMLNGELTSDGQKYASDFKAVENTIRDALGELGSNSRNKAVYNEKIHMILDNNAKYYMGPEQDLHGPNIYVRKANDFWRNEFNHGRLTNYLDIVAGKIRGYVDGSGKLFAEYDEETGLMERIKGVDMPKDVTQWLGSEPAE